MHVRLPLLLLTLLLCGCSPEPEPAPPSPPATAPPSAARTTEANALDTSGAAVGADTVEAAWTDGPVEVDRSVDQATLQAVRSAAHEGFDRVVFEFEEAQLPGYHVAYTDEPVRQCGSGNPVSLAGEHRLEIRFSRTRAHTEAGAPTVADRSRTPDLPLLRALTLTCDFEGMVTWVLGLAAPAPFRITELATPARLVVDVRR